MGQGTKTERISDLRERFIRGAKLSITRICDDYGVGTRTAQRDIAQIESMGISLAQDTAADPVVWFAPTESRKFLVRYNLNEVLALFTARRFFDFLENTTLEDAFNRVYSRIESQLACNNDAEIAQKLTNKVYLIHEGPKKLKSRSSEILDECLTALLRERKLKISYRNAKGKVERRLLCPYTLTVYKRGLYLVGSCEQNDNAVRIYALERMTKADWQKDMPFTYPANWNPETYFKDAFCIVTGAPQKVVVHFTPQSKRYIQIRAFHHSQKVKTLKDGTVEMRLTVPVNFELVNWLLSFGPHVEVIQPEQLRKEVAGQLQATLSQYGAEISSMVDNNNPQSLQQDTLTMDLFNDLEQ